MNECDSLTVSLHHCSLDMNVLHSLPALEQESLPVTDQLHIVGLGYG